MTDPTDPRGLPPEQEAVRRLLADARHHAPTPPEVVARLDATLASLTAERGPAAADTVPVIHLRARRRRMAGMGLLAAAAVVVAGVALGQGLPSTDGGSDASSAAGGAALGSERSAQDDSGGGDAGAQPEELGQQSLKSGAPSPFAAYPTLSSDDTALDEELLALRDTATAEETPASAEYGMGCNLRGTGPGRRVLAQVDGEVGAIVFRRAEGTTQQVDLYTCGEPTPVRTLTLPAP